MHCARGRQNDQCTSVSTSYVFVFSQFRIHSRTENGSGLDKIIERMRYNRRTKLFAEWQIRRGKHPGDDHAEGGRIHREEGGGLFVCCCLTSQQHASVSQGRICSANFTCCHTEIKAADQTFHLTQSQYTDTGPTSPSADPITPRRLAG